jgi:hypothetical protein
MLAPILTALASDGAELRMGAITESTLRLHLDTTNACEECVISDEMLEDIVLGHLRTVDATLGIEHVEIDHGPSDVVQGERGGR